MRGVVVSLTFVSLVSLAAIACVDGTTPDCSTPASGCFPGEGGTPEASSEASTDGATDAAKDADVTDGESDAGDASLVTDANLD